MDELEAEMIERPTEWDESGSGAETALLASRDSSILTPRASPLHCGIEQLATCLEALSLS